MSKLAFVFILDGTVPREIAVKRLVATLARECNVEDASLVNVRILNEDDIVNACVNKAVQSSIIASQSPSHEVEMSPEVAAAVYIGTLFSEELNSGLSTFASTLSARYALACLQHTDEKLRRSIMILAKSSISLPNEIATKYNIGLLEHNAIKQIYNSLCQGHIVTVDV